MVWLGYGPWIYHDAIATDNPSAYSLQSSPASSYKQSTRWPFTQGSIGYRAKLILTENTYSLSASAILCMEWHRHVAQFTPGYPTQSDREDHSFTIGFVQASDRLSFEPTKRPPRRPAHKATHNTKYPKSQDLKVPLNPQHLQQYPQLSTGDYIARTTRHTTLPVPTTCRSVYILSSSS